MTVAQIESTTEARELAAASETLQRLHDRLTETVEELTAAKNRQRVLTEELAEAEAADDEARVQKISREIATLEQRKEQLTAREAGLRKATAQQHATVQALREPVERMQVERAIVSWLRLLEECRRFADADFPLIGPVASGLGYSPRMIDAPTGRRLSWGPTVADVADWIRVTEELVTQLRKAGYRIEEA